MNSQANVVVNAEAISVSNAMRELFLCTFLKLRRVDSSLMAWRKRLQLASLLLALCLVALVNIVGGSEFLSIAKSSLQKLVCCIDRTRNPFQP